MELFLRPVGTVLPKTADVSIVLDADGEYRYYIDSVAQKGWQYIDGDMYYFLESDGAMLRDGTYVVYSDLCAFDANGKYIADAAYEIVDDACYFGGYQVYGWQTVDGDKYYFSKSSGMLKNGAYVVGSALCYFDAEGKQIAEPTYEIVDGKCYFGGTQMFGWQTIEGNKYYFSTKSGLMLKDGTYVVGSKQYTFDANGICA